jgi:hypothetical protein
MKTALLELQKALFSKLTSSSALMNKVTGVYDMVPQELIDTSGNVVKTAFPYITLDISTNNGFDTKTSIGENIVYTIHTWSKYEGKKETYDIFNLIFDALKTPLSIGSGFSIARFEPERPTVITDIDGLTKHGILNLTYWIL